MTATLTITTLKGAKIELTADYGVSAQVNGRDDLRFSGVELKSNAALGDHLSMGPLTAQIKPEDVELVERFFAAERMASKALTDAYAASDEGKAESFSSRMDRRMYGRNSDH